MKKTVGEGMKFERIRRVTGYLSGDVENFNDAKRAEERARVKHSGVKEVMKEKKCA
jgi:anaerobic ribonucleoside-triphosphate reductase